MEKYNLGEGNESLKKILLMMKYDNKKTLSENENNLKITLNENSVNYYWSRLNRDTRDKFAKINAAVSGAGTDEDKFIEGVKLLTKNDFGILEDLLYKVGMGGYRSFTDMVNGELGVNDLKYVKDIVNHLVNIGFKSGYRESRGRFVENSFTVETPDTTQNITTTTTTVKQNKYKQCSGTYKIYCFNKNVIGKVQGCLGLKQDGYFGPKTQNALKSIGYNYGFTDNDIDTICNKKNQTPEINNSNNITAQSQITADSDIDPKYNV
jgi:hypothetical protein